MTPDQQDSARALRIERAIEAAKRGDHATVLGILAGMPDTEQAAYGPTILRFFPPAVTGLPPLEPADAR